MTRDDIIRMAIQAGAEQKMHGYWSFLQDDIERFAALVAAAERNRTWTQEHWTEYECSIAAAEREACAKLLETTDLSGLKDNPAIQSWVAEMLLAYVKAIRARGQA